MGTEDEQKGTTPTSGIAPDASQQASNQPEVYTRDEVRKIQSGLDKQLAGLQKQASQAAASAQAAEQRAKLAEDALAQIQKERDEAELNAAKGDPDLMKVYQDNQAMKQARQELLAARATLDAEKQAHKERLEAAEAIERTKMAENGWLP